MSNAVVNTAPQGKDWSGPVFHREAAVLHKRYCTFFGEVKRSIVLLVAQLHSGNFMNESDASLQDGYRPLITLIFRFPRGKVALVFPKFDDRTVADGTTTDRSVTVNTTGYIMPEEVVSAVDMLLMYLPPSRPPPNCEWPPEYSAKTCRVLEDA